VLQTDLQKVWYMHRVVGAALFFVLFLGFRCAPAEAQQPSGSPAKPVSAPTPIQLSKIAMEAESALNSLQQIEASISSDRSTLGAATGRLSNLRSGIDASIADDTSVLTARPSLDVLHRLKITSQNFDDQLSASARDLTRRVTSLEEQIARLVQLSKTWGATLQPANQPDVPPAVLQRVQSVVDSVERTQKDAESGRAEILTLQSNFSADEDRVRAALSSIGQAQNRALKDLLVTDSPPIWSSWTDLGKEWSEQGGESFSSQLNAASAFAKRLPSSFFTHALLIVLIAAAIRWMRGRIQNLAEVKADLQRTAPILGLPVSTAFVISLLVVPSMYPQAPRCIQAILGAVALLPTLLILGRLLQRNMLPILYAMVVLYFVGQLRVVAASLPGLARLLFLGQMLGGFLFLVWLIRAPHNPTPGSATSDRFSRAIHAIAKIGLIMFLAAFLANIFGYVNLGNLLGLVYLRSAYFAAILYAAIRIVEGLINIALQVRPLATLQFVRLHRQMLHRRACRVLEFLAFLFWLERLLDFFGLRTPLIEKTEEALNAKLAIGSFNISPGQILAFVITVWASFLISRFLRFVLEEDVYQHLRLARGVPHAISTMLHYMILLLGFFLALGVLGIDLTKITILAGAFSLGIGFGLQNVINNFVSGLILLFERPIKIGDVIDVGGNIGEVRRIGIRASVIRTADAAEIIVPNGSLISSQVTNWTFSDRQRGIEVSVNAVAGADPQRVVELLKNAAASQPGIAKEPAPQVYVVNFTAGAMTFQLRAWTDRYEDWAQVRSNLAVAVNEALVRDKIGIA
jgi:potassium-dependent mechanosensitive channel